MEENKEKEIKAEEVETEIIPEPEIIAEVAEAAAVAEKPPFRGRDNRDNRGFRKNTRKAPRREPRVKPEFDNKLLEVRRVARVVAGGRRFSFSASVVIGNRKGKVGVGVGKASDTPIAIEKGVRDAKKNMVSIPLTKTSSIRHSVEAKYGGSQIVINPAPGKGIVAGSSARDVLELLGITAVSSKFLSRSKNKLNNAKAAVKALSKLQREVGEPTKTLALKN